MKQQQNLKYNFIIIGVFLLIMILLFCILTKEELYISPPNIGVVTMVKNPIDYGKWIEYYLDFLKIDKIYIRVEDTPSLEPTLKLYSGRYKGRIDYVLSGKVDFKNTYDDMQGRQSRFINDCISKAKVDNIQYLIHADDDELFMINNKYKNVGDFFKTVPKSVDNVHFKNIEAVFPNETPETCFSTDRFINCSKGSCKSYANGKSAGKVSNSLQPRGPHYFNGKTLNIDVNDACVLHFESCNFEKWYDKFKTLSDIDDKVFNKIPFKFYKDSIIFIKECGEKKLAN